MNRTAKATPGSMSPIVGSHLTQTRLRRAGLAGKVLDIDEEAHGDGGLR